jgi:hypothetical protein
MKKINRCQFCQSNPVLNYQIINPACTNIFVMCPSCLMRGPSITIKEDFRYTNYSAIFTSYKEDVDRVIFFWNNMSYETE